MKSTGIVRKVDELGRIVLPIELRRTLDINERDAHFMDTNQIILKNTNLLAFSATTQRCRLFQREKYLQKLFEELKK